MWANPQFPADLVTFTEQIFDGKLHFLYSEYDKKNSKLNMRTFKKYVTYIMAIFTPF